MANNLTTLANALQWLNQPSDTNDIVARLITAASTEIQNWLGYQVVRATYNRTFDGQGTRQFFVPDLPLVSVQSLTIDGMAIPQGVFSGGAQQAGFYSNAYAIGLIGYLFTCGFQNVTVAYTAGYTAVPSDIEQACLDWVKISFSNQSLPGIGGNAVSVRAGDSEINWGGKGNVTDVNLVPMPSDIFRKLQNYRRVAQITGF